MPEILGASSTAPPGDSVPRARPNGRPPALLSPAARRDSRRRMLLLRSAALDRIVRLARAPRSALVPLRRELRGSDLPNLLLDRGAGPAYVRELPQGALLYLLVRLLRPARVLETGIRPGYSTAWILAALEANRFGELTSLGPGPTAGRGRGVADATVGQMVAPRLRSRWTLVLGNTEARLRSLLDRGDRIDLFFYDNGPDPHRAAVELRWAWAALSPRGVLLAHHVDAHPAWNEFCRIQGVAPQILDPGPPPMGGLGMAPDERP
ncbi:MAG: class I SAM-dependent methyltransferase [Thermoplasmata archaeon]